MTQTIIHIGCPKAGSTFLQNYFFQNPFVNFNNNDFNKLNLTGILSDDDIQKFKVDENYRILSSEHLSVPAFGFYNVGIVYKDIDLIKYREDVAEKLQKMFPNAKILMVVRGFESLIPSVYSQYVSIGGCLTFSQFLKTYKDVIIDLFDYDYIFNLYSRFFGKTNICVLPYELLKKNPPKFISIIEHEFGIGNFSFDYKTVNRSISSKYIPFVIKTSKLAHLMISVFPVSKQFNLTLYYAKLLLYVKDRWLSKKPSDMKFDDIENILKDLKLRAIKVSNLKLLVPFKTFYT